MCACVRAVVCSGRERGSLGYKEGRGENVAHKVATNNQQVAATAGTKGPLWNGDCPCVCRVRKFNTVNFIYF